MFMPSSNSPDAGQAATSESSTSKIDTPTFSQCAQQQSPLPMWPKTDNSPTSVPSLTGAQKRLQANFWNLPSQQAKQSTGWHAQKHDYPSNTRNDSVPWPAAKLARLSLSGPVKQAGSGLTSSAYRSRQQNPSSSLGHLDAAKRLGSSGAVLSLRCGCVILTCCAHSDRTTTSASCSMTCRSPICP